ncbi:MAG TPA: ROK family protein [Acholeplasmataceae bacterium]|nr:ROK family protein [Acholeplasmataceae bacterium]
MNTSNSQSVKIDNMKLVVERLIELRESSRIELARLTTLNKATISSIINELVEKEIVIETDKNIKTSGRSAKVVALNKNAGRIISIELLTDSLYGVVTNLYGQILYELRKDVPDPEFNPYLAILLQAIDELRANTKDSTYGVIGIGIGVYGILSKQKRIKFATFTSWKDIDLKQIIEDYTGIETYVENEANISALGEHVISPQTDNLVSLNIGIGVGMGIIIDNRLYTGENGYAGEIGHTIVVPNGRKCVCGNYGCLEKYISNPAIVQSYYELSGETIDLDQFVELYKHKDAHACKIYQQFIDYVALTINNISLTLNPKTIVINSQIIEKIPESVSLIKNKLRSQIMNLEVLSTSSFPSKTNVMGLTHVLIQKFLNVEHYKIPATSKSR